ncbi:MAG: lipopolysaccharide biosynthesis protein [Pirellulaceae bacterium]
MSPILSGGEGAVDRESRAVSTAPVRESLAGEVLEAGQPGADASEVSTVSLLRKLLGIGWTVGASVGTFGFFAIQGVILARILGPADRGVFAAAVLFPQALLYPGMLGAPELFASYAAQGAKNAELRRSAVVYGAFAGILTCLACVGLNWATIPENMRHVLPWAMLCAATMPLQQIRFSVQAVDHGQRRFKRYNTVRLAAAATFPALLVIGWVLGLNSVPQAAMLFVAAQVIALGLIQVGMPSSWIGERAVGLKRALSEAKGLMGAWWATELLERLDLVLVMVLIANDRVLGFYAAAVPIASLMIIVPNAAGLYAFNRGARESENLTPSDAWRFIGLGLGIQILCAAALAAVLPFLVPLFYGDDFSPTVHFAWLLLPAGIFRGLLQAADSYLRARKRPVAGIVARCVAIPVLLLISIGGQSSLGDASIPIGLSVAQGLCFVIVAAALLRDTRGRRSSIELAAQ